MPRVTDFVPSFDGRKFTGNIKERVYRPQASGEEVIGEYKLSWMEGGRIIVEHAGEKQFYDYAKSTLNSITKFLKGKSNLDEPKGYMIYFNRMTEGMLDPEKLVQIYKREDGRIIIDQAIGDGEIGRKVMTKRWKNQHIEYNIFVNSKDLVKVGLLPYSRWSLNEDMTLDFLETIDHTNFGAVHKFPCVSVTRRY